jgi:UDP-2-acetamido-3-amino-2,3-dideoxy-glucuronate N-acetyltransferase
VDVPIRFFVDETAIVEDDVTIGERTHIWHHCHIRRGATIGRECTLGKNVFVDAGTVIGNRVKIQNNVSVFAGVHLADDVFVGPSAVFTNDLLPRAHARRWTLRETIIQRGAAIGANATLLCGIQVGEWAMIGAGAVVTRSVDPHELIVGNPAHRLGWVCRCGSVLVRTSESLSRSLQCEHCGTWTRA